MGDLDKLIAAVEAGDMWSETQYAVFGNGTDLVNAYQAAFDGSLDAALRLHEALLPGWGWGAGPWGARVWLYSDNPKWDGSNRHEIEMVDAPARAFLLAILRALQAQPTPSISPEEAQFNAVRYHERFGPLDEKGNPLDPRRRG